MRVKAQQENEKEMPIYGTYVPEMGDDNQEIDPMAYIRTPLVQTADTLGAGSVFVT